MADVYRKGTKSVYVGWRRAPGIDLEFTPCNLDAGGDWGPAPIPEGARCVACFGRDDNHDRSGKRAPGPGRSKAAFAGTAAALALAAAVFASSLGEPVNILIPASGDVTSTPFAVTPGPAVPPTEAPALTPGPTDAVPTLQPAPQPLPTSGPVPTYPPVPTWPPLPTFVLPVPLPTLPLPVVCRHPGLHVGVLDPCKWPHQ